MKGGFDHMVQILTCDPRGQRTITAENYSQWRDQLLFDLVSGQRLGQSFCNFYNIGGSPLYHFSDNAIAQNWINTHYLSGVTDETEVD